MMQLGYKSPPHFFLSCLLLSRLVQEHLEEALIKSLGDATGSGVYGPSCE